MSMPAAQVLSLDKEIGADGSDLGGI
jgi:hypothetical protein